MDLYLLDAEFRRRAVVDDFSSVIWTERYDKAGDVALVVPLSENNIKKYPAGIFLSTPVSNEVMILESVLKDYDAGTLKCTGPTLTAFLNQRPFRSDELDFSSTNPNWVVRDLEDRLTPAQVINYLVSQVCLSDGIWTSRGLNVIPHLTVEDPVNDEQGFHNSPSWTVPWGPLYDVIVDFAKSYGIGFKLYLESATDTGYRLKFVTYRGRFLTKASAWPYPQESHEDTVMFSSKMDTLAHIKELHSLANYKNLVATYASCETKPYRPGYAFIDDPLTEWSAWYGVSLKVHRGFGLRRMDVVVDDLSNFSGDPDDLVAILDQRARSIMFKQNESTRIVDGEVVPNAQINKYGRDYMLGDIVGLQAMDGDFTPVRVIEYIRSQDETGTREYPTVSVMSDDGSSFV